MRESESKRVLIATVAFNLICGADHTAKSWRDKEKNAKSWRRIQYPNDAQIHSTSNSIFVRLLWLSTSLDGTRSERASRSFGPTLVSLIFHHRDDAIHLGKGIRCHLVLASV